MGTPIKRTRKSFIQLRHTDYYLPICIRVLYGKKGMPFFRANLYMYYFFPLTLEFLEVLFNFRIFVIFFSSHQTLYTTYILHVLCLEKFIHSPKWVGIPKSWALCLENIERIMHGCIKTVFCRSEMMKEREFFVSRLTVQNSQPCTHVCAYSIRYSLRNCPKLTQDIMVLWYLYVEAGWVEANFSSELIVTNIFL